jgi:hypothetical protein
MKTNDLIALLATGAEPVEANTTARRYAAALGWGAFGAALLMAILLGVRNDIEVAAHQPMFWIKLGLPTSVAVAGVLAVFRLSRPGARVGWAPWLMLLPVAVVWSIAAFALVGTPPAGRVQLVMGSTWRYCLTHVPLLSLPAMVAMMWAMKGLAPTRLALAGAASGIVAGAIGAAIYALHCPEM